MQNPRQVIRERAAERGLSLTALSVLAGRNVAYIQQFVERGVPRALPDEPRLRIAMALDLDERLLGAREPWMPAVGRLGHEADR